MHLCPEHLCGRRPGPRGLTSRGCSLAFSHRWALRGLDYRHPKVRRKKGPALPPFHSLPPLFSLPGLRAASAGVSPPVLRRPSRPELGGGSAPPPTAPDSPHTYKFLAWPSESRPQNGPRGVCGQPPPARGQHWHHRADATRYCPPGLRKAESCNLLLLRLPQQPPHALC